MKTILPVEKVLQACQDYLDRRNKRVAWELSQLMLKKVGKRKFFAPWQRYTYSEAWDTLYDPEGHRLFSDADMVEFSGALWTSRVRDQLEACKALQKLEIATVEVNHEVLTEIF